MNNVKGKTISIDELDAIVARYDGHYTCEDMRTDMQTGCISTIYAFERNSHAYELYKSLAGFDNVGVYHGRSQETGKYLVKVDFYIV